MVLGLGALAVLDAERGASDANIATFPDAVARVFTEPRDGASGPAESLPQP